MSIQLLFYKYFVSKEYDHILKDKFNIIKSFIIKDEELLKKYNSFKTNYIKNNKDIANEQFKKREDINLKLIFKYCIIPILTALGVIITLYLLPLDNHWDEVNKYAILLISTVYIPELIIYFLVFSKYQYIGNVDIITKIFSSYIT